MRHQTHDLAVGTANSCNIIQGTVRIGGNADLTLRVAIAKHNPVLILKGFETIMVHMISPSPWAIGILNGIVDSKDADMPAN